MQPVCNLKTFHSANIIKSFLIQLHLMNNLWYVLQIRKGIEEFRSCFMKCPKKLD